MAIELSKYHGNGNDFLLAFETELSSDDAVKILDRTFGVGADGLILLERSDVADFSFVLLQPDGSTAEVSGNGLRCVAKFLFEKGHHDSTTLKIEAAGELKVLELDVSDGLVTSVTADMGVPESEGDIELQGRVWKLTNVGNPHATTIVDDIDSAPVTELGPLIENDPAFPNRTNVEFIKVEGDVVHARFWERAVGVTLSSGTGSCAAFVASGLQRAVVRSLGGDLSLELVGGRLFLSGPAVHICDVTVPEGFLEERR